MALGTDPAQNYNSHHASRSPVTFNFRRSGSPSTSGSGAAAMAAGTRLRAAPGAARPRLPVQLLPCRVERDGPAPVAAFLRVQPGPGGGERPRGIPGPRVWG